MRELILRDRGLILGDCLVFDEDIKQIKKWGYQKHNVFNWLAFTTEELGELSQAISEYIYRDGKLEDIEKEAIQVATLALKMAVMTRQAISDKAISDTHGGLTEGR